jgi:hypothetical protein
MMGMRQVEQNAFCYELSLEEHEPVDVRCYLSTASSTWAMFGPT